MLLDTSPLVSDSPCLLVCLLVCAWPQVPRTLYYDALVKFGFVGGTSEANDLGFTDAPDTVFERLDSNQNGFLSVEELEAGLKGIFKDKARAPQPPATPPLNKSSALPRAINLPGLPFVRVPLTTRSHHAMCHCLRGPVPRVFFAPSGLP